MYPRVGSEEECDLVLLFISDIDRSINIFSQVGVIDVEQRRSRTLFQMDGDWRTEMKAMERLDVLEGHLVANDDRQGNAIVDIGAGDSEVKVRGTLLRHIEAWEAAGAGAFALGVIKEGFRLSMWSTPRAYEEGNNKSFEKDREFAVEAIQKLVKLEILKEVGRSEVTCVGKRRLCIDLSRGMNEVNASYKFKIESILRFLQMVKQGDRRFAFDLKSAYQQLDVQRALEVLGIGS